MRRGQDLMPHRGTTGGSLRPYPSRLPADYDVREDDFIPGQNIPIEEAIRRAFEAPIKELILAGYGPETIQEALKSLKIDVIMGHGIPLVNFRKERT